MAYEPEDVVPRSGIYKVLHDPMHAAPHEATCIEGKKFLPRAIVVTIPRLLL
jgi:hypothetical protein